MATELHASSAFDTGRARQLVMNEIEENVLAVMATEHDALDDVECAQHAGLTVAQAANALRSLARAGFLVEVGDQRADGSFDGYGTYNLTPTGTRLGKAIADRA